MADQKSDLSILPKLAINVTRLPKLGNTIKLSLEDREMGTDENAGIVDHLGVESVEMLEALLTFRPWAKDGVQVDGKIQSVLHTQCPVSLEMVEQDLHSEFKAKFVPPHSKLAKPQLNDDGEMIIDYNSDDIPDILEDETLDAWAIAMEYLMLEIDYFARSDNATFEQPMTSDPADEEKISPFAKLQTLKK